jgi:putative endonuclease
MSTRKIFGSNGEAHIAQFLEMQGYTILARNYKKMHGEIDLIAKKDQELVFVEVKTRSSSYIEPEYLISPAQQRKIISTALTYIAEHDLVEYVWRFDAALLIGSPPHQKLTYIPNAFTQEENV